MASICRSSGTKATRADDEVYVAAVSLRATRGPAQLLMSTAYSLNLWNFQHFMVIIKPSSPLPSQTQKQAAVVFDFQPQDPENIYVALAALSGNKVPGAILTRKLTKLPKTKCWFIGSCEIDAVEATYKFNQSWQTDLRIGHHDCRDYTNGLVELLTGQKYVLERLRSDRR
ncbi:hypothetical protein LguiA_035315 [Lonicera macranthoides]